MPEWPLVGRDEELRTLGGLLLGPTPRSVVLAGPSGVGKTRLGHECLLQAERDGTVTARTTGTRSAAQLPFGAVSTLLPDASPPPGRGPVDDRADLLRRSVAALAERSADDRLLLFVDDAHLLDDASATLIHQVAATGTATVLATVRTGEPVPDPVVALWKDGLAERVEIGGLGREAVGELLTAVLGGPVDPATVVELHERSRGNVLLLRELVTGAIDEGSLQDESGIWRLSRLPSPSARLVEIVEARLGRLDDAERALMELVSYGEPLGQAELSALSDPAVADALERRDLLVSRMDGRRLQIHLAHPIYGDVVRARTPLLRTRAIAGSLADAVESTGDKRPDDPLRVATWRLLAGGGDPDVLLAGARIARWRYDLVLAERLARAAVEAGAGFDAALLAAHVTGLQGRRDEAEDELVALSSRAVDDTERGQVAIARFDNTGAWTQRDEQGVLEQAEATITDPDWLDRLEARRIGLNLVRQGPRAGVEAAVPLVERARGEALVFACLVGAQALARVGRLDEALEMSARGHAERLSVDVPLAWYPWWHTVTRCRTLRYAGRFDEAEEIITAHHDQALVDGSPEAQSAFALLAAEGVAERGRATTAARRACEALAVDEELGHPLLVRQDHIAGALALALGGRAEEAAAELAAVDALGLPSVLFDQADLLRARAWTTVAEGDLPRGRAVLEQAADLGHEIGDLVGEVAALHDLARLGSAPDVRDRLADRAGRMDGDLAPARTNHVDALARGDAELLEKVSRDFESMGADLLAAEAAADAAVVLRRAGEAREAGAAEHRAIVLADRCENPSTPALHPVEARARLTPAERETAVLAAAGRSNKDIAGQLHLSPRTVENRLQRVYEKLGVSGRTELSAALAPED